MSGHNDDLKLKLAWQTAFELRTCPDGETLHASDQDENLNRHLAICHVCREKRKMNQLERSSWRTLKEKFALLAIKPGIGTEKQVGQIWTIKKEFGGWRDDGRYIRPPSVLLLEHIDETNGWRVAQLYGDKQMMGNDDIELDESYGFAEAWNCYSLRVDRFDKYIGGVKSEVLKRIITASVASVDPAPEGSHISFFRRMEIEVGAYVAIPAVAALVEEWEASQESVTVDGWLENMFGSFADVFKHLVNFEVPTIADTLSDLLSGARAVGLATNLSMASSLTSLPVNIVSKKADGEIGIKTISASITDDDWQEGTYFIAGKLDDEFPAGLHLLAWLTYNGEQLGECINQMTENSPYFDIVFRSVPKEACTLENIKFLLVSP